MSVKIVNLFLYNIHLYKGGVFSISKLCTVQV